MGLWISLTFDRPCPQSESPETFRSAIMQGRVATDTSKAEAMRAVAAKAFRPQAKLQIGAIELRQVTAPVEPEKR
jgi:hypothetical protein